MIDTIRVKFPLALTDFQKLMWNCVTTRVKDGEREKYIYNPESGGTVFRFTYFPESFDGSPMLTLEFSLPKLIFGNNYQMVENIQEAIKLANEKLAKVRDIPKLDLAEGILIRLDLCYNHQVGEAVNDYINALGCLDYPHRRTKGHRYEGVEYRSKHKTTKFYDKQHESRHEEAFGILRQEITFLKGKDVQRLLENKKPTLPDLDLVTISEALKDDLQNLHLLNNSIATYDMALQKLCDAYGSEAGIYYFGLLIAKMERSRKQIINKTQMHPRSLDRKLKKIVDLDMPLTLVDRKTPLPPLTIDL